MHIKWLKILGIGVLGTTLLWIADSTNAVLFGFPLNTWGEYFWNFGGLLSGAWAAIYFNVR
ncbi:hypothetical protein LCGC14_1346730 [marine sediment metagenome]|uniref:Uncharacterized protein n=1 Tax=marine sediment metagenome TaxID=412755 RepID=A0A0F9KC43_9ZZZZ